MLDLLKRSTVGAALVVLLGCGLSACDGEVLGVGYGGGEYEQRIRVGDRLRDYVVYVPRSASEAVAAPLLLVFHGATMSAETMMLLSWFNPEAERLGFVVAYLQSAEDQWATGGASSVAAERVDDLAFVEAVIDRLDRDVRIDRTRVYASGYSNGALFAQRLACVRSDRIAAVAIVGATISIPVTDGCSPTRPVPAIFFVGDRDPSFAWSDPGAAAQLQFSGEGSAEFWARLNQCDPGPSVEALPDAEDDGTSVERWTFAGCAASARVDFYHILGGGHTWPGSPLNLSSSLGRKSRDVEASPLIADFLTGVRIGGGQ